MQFSVCAALSDRPMFAEPIPNVTVPLGRDVSLPCVVENLGNYKVIKSKNVLFCHSPKFLRILTQSTQLFINSYKETCIKIKVYLNRAKRVHSDDITFLLPQKTSNYDEEKPTLTNFHRSLFHAFQIKRLEITHVIFTSQNSHASQIHSRSSTEENSKEEGKLSSEN